MPPMAWAVNSCALWFLVSSLLHLARGIQEEAGNQDDHSKAITPKRIRSIYIFAKTSIYLEMAEMQILRVFKCSQNRRRASQTFGFSLSPSHTVNPTTVFNRIGGREKPVLADKLLGLLEHGLALLRIPSNTAMQSPWHSSVAEVWFSLAKVTMSVWARMPAANFQHCSEDLWQCETQRLESMKNHQILQACSTKADTQENHSWATDTKVRVSAFIGHQCMHQSIWTPIWWPPKPIPVWILQLLQFFCGKVYHSKT